MTTVSDFRARDLPGWPSEQSHAFLIHATQADRTFEGIDLSVSTLADQVGACTTALMALPW